MALSTTITTRPSPPVTPARMLEVDILRALCCFGVLMIHISGFYMAQPTRDPSLAHAISFALINEGVRYALFGFVFISALLLTIRHGGTFSAGSFLAKRVKVVLIPYLAWVGLYFVLLARNSATMRGQLVGALHGSSADLSTVMQWLLYGTWPHLYFINLLFQLYLLYAVLYRPIQWTLATKRRGMIMLGLVFLLYPLWDYFHFLPYRHPELELPPLLLWVAKNPNRQVFEWLAPFALGLYGGMYYQELLAWIRRNYRMLWLVMLGALLITSIIAFVPWVAVKAPSQMLNYGWPLSYLLPLGRLAFACSLNCLVLAGAFAYLQRLEGRQPAWLRYVVSFAGVSFGIYLVHPVFLAIFRGWQPLGIHHGLSFSLYNVSWFLYLIIITGTVTGLSYAAVAGMKALGKRWRGARWAYTILFGR